MPGKVKIGMGLLERDMVLVTLSFFGLECVVGVLGRDGDGRGTC